jgi:superfamily II DNA or RNA helicase
MLRDWQSRALALWIENNRRGIVSAVTGGGKTILALEAIKHSGMDTTLVVVPTVALLDQWWVEAAEYFNISLDEVHIVRSSSSLRTGTINVAVINTAARMRPNVPCFLVVDECHKAASPKFRSVLSISNSATLGLSATPERPYDSWLDDILVPTLGPILFRYSYREALADGVIVPFTLRNVVFELEPSVQAEYERLTRSIARSIAQNGIDATETIAVMLKRSRLINMSEERIKLAVRVVARHRGQRVLIFHENIEACDVIQAVLTANGIRTGAYHSRMPARERAESLASFRSGHIDVLVTCRALDEGFNVPEAEIGIVAASTATERQRIQRLGRVLRPASSKDTAVIYTFVGTPGEVERLKSEEKALEGVASIEWGRA